MQQGSGISWHTVPLLAAMNNTVWYTNNVRCAVVVVFMLLAQTTQFLRATTIVYMLYQFTGFDIHLLCWLMIFDDGVHYVIEWMHCFVCVNSLNWTLVCWPQEASRTVILTLQTISQMVIFDPTTFKKNEWMNEWVQSFVLQGRWLKGYKILSGQVRTQTPCFWVTPGVNRHDHNADVQNAMHSCQYLVGVIIKLPGQHGMHLSGTIVVDLQGMQVTKGICRSRELWPAHIKLAPSPPTQSRNWVRRCSTGMSTKP